VSTSHNTTEPPGDARPTYRQEWSAYNAAQVNEKAFVAELLRDLCAAIDTPPQKCGRPRLPWADTVFCAAMKVYGGASGRRSMTDLREYAARGYIGKVPCYNSIFNALENPDLTPILRALVEESARPLRAVETDFAVDSTGFSTSVHRRWFDAKYGRVQSMTLFVKAHAMVGVKTNIVTSVDATPGNINDYPLLEPLLASTVRRFDVARLSADKGYSGRSNVAAISAAGVVPLVAFKTNAKAGPPGPWRDSFDSFRTDPDAFYRAYHQRSNVETTFSMIKAKFGGFVRSKTPVAQRNEVLCKVLAHNLCVLVQAFFELGVEPRFWGNGTAALGEPYAPAWTQNLPGRAPWTGARKKGRKPCHVIGTAERPLPLFGGRDD
jgi:transposase